MSLAIVSSLINGTGNRTTAQRIREYYKNEFKTIHLCETNDYETADDFERYIEQNNVTLVLGIHLVKTGRLLVNKKVPFIMIAGGTDMNISIKNETELNIMRQVVEKAFRILVFTHDMKKKALEFWPHLHSRILVQPQCISINTTLDYSYSDLFKEFQRDVSIDFNKTKVFLLISGIRGVKDPLYLAQVISTWNKKDSMVLFVIIGPVLDAEYARECNRRLADLNGVYMFSEISSEKVFSLMRQSFAVVNSSLNEGMCSAILEAMCVGTPVLARLNEGNLSLITDYVNGLIFKDEDEFLLKTSLLFKSSSLRKSLVENGKSFVDQNHSIGKERETYIELIRDLMKDISS